MIAVGNDVIDLSWSPRNGDRYYQRLSKYAFSKSELQLIDPLLTRNLGCMLLWSIKESCYKSAKKRGLSDKFLPKNIQISCVTKSVDSLNGIVKFKDVEFNFESVLEGELIHTVTYSKQFELEGVLKGTAFITSTSSSTQSQAVRNLVRSLDVKSDWRFEKKMNGIPKAYCNDVERDISFSHEGKVIGFAVSK